MPPDLPHDEKRITGETRSHNGGAAGLGADVARTLSEAGYRIGIFDLGAERVAEAASKLENAVGIEADVTSPDQVAAAFDAFGEYLTYWSTMRASCDLVLWRSSPFRITSMW